MAWSEGSSGGDWWKDYLIAEGFESWSTKDVVVEGFVGSEPPEEHTRPSRKSNKVCGPHEMMAVKSSVAAQHQPPHGDCEYVDCNLLWKKKLKKTSGPKMEGSSSGEKS
ncbi:hypothetical protein SUGI_1035560 [Cryptomeria japonica]|nr:hypothetical protein SUGI_1035560 [Cryptomeria japonica]